MAKNIKGNYTVSAYTLADINRDYLPEKFEFKVSGDDIEISQKDFSLTCQRVLFDDPNSESSKHFIACVLTGKGRYTVTFLSVNPADPENILLDNVSDFYYTDEMLKENCLAVITNDHEPQWRIFCLAGEDKGKLLAIDSFVEDQNLPLNSAKIACNSEKRRKVYYNGVIGTVLEMLFTKTINFASYIRSPVADKSYIIGDRAHGSNIFELYSNSFSALLGEDIYLISFLEDEIESPPTNCTYYQIALALYEDLLKRGIRHLILIPSKEKEKKYFNFVEKRYLASGEAEELDNKIKRYKEELCEAKEFDFMEG